ncbi:hypothetical protein NP493_1373g00035 [Ridgeia piscesae]|uniref:Fibrinogen C-terminal domain-containing protein n=1 Tax=Ridgeia piscesae TaxID=27915 RepID=A0AAD9K5I2_RIDPI|nr:hypothetical protein NP493_1373g00035 [Ridgeia piscesae]
MCTSVCPVSLLAVVVVAFVVHPAPVVCQCTTGHCHDDGDNDVSVLTAMVSRLQDTVEQLQQELRDSKAELQQQLSDSTEQQQKQLTKLTETLAKQEKSLKRWFGARDCYDLLRDGNNVSGVYEVYLAKARKFVRVFCDMDTNDGGWLVFQRRQDGSIDFYRDWASYKEGFGDVDGEFWLGNDYIHEITTQKRYVLRIDMADFEKESRYAVYSSFAVASETDKYKFSLGTYSGNAGDAMTYHANRPFSTKDRDNDAASGSCAQTYKGAWWYGGCHDSNLNGAYLGGSHTSYADGIEWEFWRGLHYSLKKVTMKLRP